MNNKEMSYYYMNKNMFMIEKEDSRSKHLTLSRSMLPFYTT